MRKLLRLGTGLLALFGFILIMGAVGTSDYYAELGIDYPLSEVVRYSLIGAVLMTPAGVVFKEDLWK